MIPYGRQHVTAGDIDAVAAVLRSDLLTQGPVVPRFEHAVAARCGAAHAVAVNSATAALHIACLALDLGPGDRLWTSPITFVASANCGRYCGAEVDFVDVDARTGNMDPAALAARLEEAARSGRLPKVVVPVHFAGQSCDMAAIGALARRYGFRVVEDASHAIGGAWEGDPVGACRHSDIAVFSFHPVKIVTSGEGGMALTQDAELAARMALLRTHGITRDPAQMQAAPEGPWSYEQVVLGFNYRMTDIHAALGLSQLTRIDEYLERRLEIAARYDARLEGLALVRPWRDPRGRPALHLYVVQLPGGTPPARRREVFVSLRAQGIGVQVHYIPVHLQPYYARSGFRRGDFPVAERFYAGALSLPLFPALGDDDQDSVVAALQRALAA